MKNNLITFKELKKWTGYEQQSKIVEVLQQNNIKFIVVKDGISTTLDAINSALNSEQEKRQITL